MISLVSIDFIEQPMLMIFVFIEKEDPFEANVFEDLTPSNLCQSVSRRPLKLLMTFKTIQTPEKSLDAFIRKGLDLIFFSKTSKIHNRFISR